MMGEAHFQAHPVVVGLVPRMIGTILLLEIELPISVDMCLGRLLIHLGLRRLPGYMVAGVTTLEEAVATPGTIDHTIIICLLLPHAVAKIVSHLSQRIQVIADRFIFPGGSMFQLTTSTLEIFLEYTVKNACRLAHNICRCSLFIVITMLKKLLVMICLSTVLLQIHEMIIKAYIWFELGL
jgi:hypothetical protein